MQSPLNPASVAISGVVLLPLIISLIQFAKRFFQTAPGNVWLGASFVLGVVGEVVVYLVEYGTPFGLDMWASLVVLGLSLGAAASKAYDETLGKVEAKS